MNIRAQIFGDTGPAQSPLVQVKKPKGARSDALLTIPVSRQHSRTGDTRLEDRYPLPTEPARITHNGCTCDVQLINVGGGGAMVSGPFMAALWDRLDLHLGEHGTIECRILWVKHGRVGLEFAHETRLDCPADQQSAVVRNVIARHFPDARFSAPQHAPVATAQDHRAERRHAMVWSGTLHYDYRSTPARVRNISSAGAMIETALELVLGDEPLLDLEEAGAIFGRIIWIAGDQAGMRFHQPFDMATLAKARPSIGEANWENQWKRIIVDDLDPEGSAAKP